MTEFSYGRGERMAGESVWRADVAALHNALRHPEGYGYEAQLPAVIGYMPQDEAVAFGVITPRTVEDTANFALFAMNASEVARMREHLPRTFMAIEADMAAVTAGRAEFSEVELKRQYIKQSETAQPYGLHLDLGVTAEHPEYADLPIYMLSNTEPSVFYTGPATLYMPDARNLRLRPGSLSPDGNLVQAPAGAIVRMSFATVHTSPVFSGDATRTFMRIFTGFRA